MYQIYPRSFLDANGDGMGDLAGAIRGIPHLLALGVDALWLSPFYPSPGRDGGYDVADPRDVDPRFGTLADFDRLVEAAHGVGLRVLVDLVPNHVSSDHPWFQEALVAGPGSAARGRFHFADGRGPLGQNPPSNWRSMFGGPAWTRVHEADGTPGQWYLHLFDASQPDLNWANAEVREDGLATLRFWLDRGVDGFRIDVALGLVKDDAYPDIDDPEGFIESLRMDLDDGSAAARARRERVANSPLLDRDEVQSIYREWRAVLDEYPGDRMTVAEAWVLPERAARYVAPGVLHQIFNFDFMAAPWDAGDLARIVEESIAGLGAAPPTWALSNHDSPRVVTRLGGGVQGLRRARALALIAQCLPGSLYIYQGEELGLPDADMPPSARRDPVWFRTGGAQLGRDGARVPLPWTRGEPPYGFSPTACQTWLPQPSDWQELSIGAQEADSRSTLQLYRRGLALRRSLGLGGSQSLRVSHEGHLLRIERGRNFTCLANTGPTPLSASEPGRLLLASDQESTAELIQPDSAVWIEAV